MNVDSTNTRVGINNSTPTTTLDVNGTFLANGSSTLASTAGSIFTAGNSTGTSTINGSAISLAGPTTISGTGTTAFEISGAWTNGIITNNNTINSGTGSITGGAITGSSVTDSSMTQGSVLFAGVGGLISQDNSQLFFDDTNNTFGFGTTRSGAISGTNAKLVIKGAGATSATSSLEVQDSAGSSKFFVRDDGNVGIGTNNPGAQLDIYGTATTGLYVRGDADSTRRDILIGNAVAGKRLRVSWDGNNGGVINSYDNAGGTYQALKIDANNLLLNSNAGTGNVGIGTTVPESKLVVVEANRLNSTNITNFTVRTSDTATQDFGGTIGLGGNFNSTTSYADFASIRGAKENSTAGNYAGYLAFNTVSNAGTLSEKIRITSGGNVGIGTTSPSATLTVSPQT
ncbi:MAG: hypothetical protein ACYC5G_03615, partial [Candidatus Doudnabacteria bacterium]